MGQFIDISVLLTVPEEKNPESTPPAQNAGVNTDTPATDSGSGESAGNTPATPSVKYVATLSLKDYSDPMLTHELGNKEITPGAVATFSYVVSNVWAKEAQTEFIVDVKSSDNSLSLRKSFYITIEPAFRTVTFDLNVDPKDPNQPNALAADSMQVTYGKPFTYNPNATDGSAQALPVPTRPNYVFNGWYSSYNAATGAYSNQVTNVTIFARTSNITLFAKWTGKNCTVRLDGYDYKGEKRGILTPNSIAVTYGETYETLAKVTGEGKTGANTELRGFTTKSGQEVNPEDVVDSSLHDWEVGPLTLYPVWGPARESLEGAVVEGLEESYGYTGAAIVPEVTVTIPAGKDAAGKDVPAKTLEKGRDYTVTCTDNVELSAAGKQASMLIEGAGTYKGEIAKSFRIVAGEPFLEVEGKACESGAADALELPFSGSGTTQLSAKLVTDAASGVAYSLAFADAAAAGTELLEDYAAIDAATGAITVKKPLGNLALRVSATAPAGTKFTATPATGVSCVLSVRTTALSECTVSLAATKYTYSGKAKTPSVTVKSPAGTKLVKGTDYTVKYPSGRKNVGTYKVTITGMGGYEGSVTKSFTIVPKACGKLKAAKTSQTTKYKGKTYRVYALSWSKVSGIDGYQVKRTVDKSATSTFKPSVTSARYAWEKGKTVKVQIRTYKKAAGKKLYSDWKTISVKAK